MGARMRMGYSNEKDSLPEAFLEHCLSIPRSSVQMVSEADQRRPGVT